jgi:iron complex transport system substrate-binding protein
MQKIKPGTLFIATLLLLLSSCGNTARHNNSGKPGEIVVTDFRGKSLSFDKSPTRIVCLIESALSGLYMLHSENNVVGVSSNVYESAVFEQYSELDKRIKDKTLPTPGNWDFVSLENVVALRPDLVIIWASQSESIEAIESKGIPVYGVMLKSVNDVYKEMTDLGKICGKSSRADSLIQYTKNEINKNRISCSTENMNKSKVYFMWPQGPLETSGKASTVNELIELAGATNVCTSSDEHLVVNLEKVIEWNPDIIVMWYNESKSPDDILKLPGWGNINAIRNKQVFELPSVFLCDLWTLKFQYAVKLLSSWCYPAAFTDKDLEIAKTEMLEELYRKN